MKKKDLKKEKLYLKKQDYLLKELKKIINNEYLLTYIDLLVEIKSVSGREECMPELLAYCVQNNYNHFVEGLFKTQVFLNKCRYNNDQKFIVYIYLYYLEKNKILDKNKEKYQNKCLLNIKISNIDKNFKKYNKSHYKKIKKILKHKKKSNDEKKFDVMLEKMAIIVECMQNIYLNIIINKRINRFVLKELDKNNRYLLQNMVMDNKRFYLYEEEIEKITQKVDFWTQVGLIIAGMLFALLMFYNFMINWIS